MSITSNKIVFLHLGDYKFPIWRVHIMAEALANRGYDINVICVRNNAREKEIINNVVVWNAGTGISIDKKSRYIRYVNLGKIIKNMIVKALYLKPSIIHVFDPILIPAGAYIKRKINSILLYDIYEPWIQGSLSAGKYHSAIIYYLIHTFYKYKIDGITYVYEKNPILNMLPNHLTSLWFPNVPSQESIEVFNSLRKSNTTYGKNLSEEREFWIGYLGVITRFKGYETAIKAMNELDKSYKLLIAGAFADEKIKKHLTSLVHSLNLENRVIFTGKFNSLQDILYYLEKVKVGLMIPDATGWQSNTLPAKLLDYIYWGIPIIATDLPNFKYFSNKYRIGMLFIPPKNPHILASTIKLLRNNPQLLFKLKTKNIKAARKLKSEIFEKDFINFYEKFLKNKIEGDKI